MKLPLFKNLKSLYIRQNNANQAKEIKNNNK